MDAVAAWESTGERLDTGGGMLFVSDAGPGEGTSAGPPILILHGFPSSSFDWRAVVPALRARHRVVLVDMLGYGLSDKPFNGNYSLFAQADLIETVARTLGLSEVVLVTHDVGDSVGGELLARSIEGALAFDVVSRVITNGSIYMDSVQLSAGQQLMLALPDAPLPEDQAPGEELFAASLAFTFSPDHQPSADELAAQWALVSRAGGHRLLPRLIRYVEERRVHGDRWTGAIEKHPSPLSIVWGETDPIAVVAMADRLAAARPDARLQRLGGVGHYPMIEDPQSVAAAILAAAS
jgi:pimeloyl-ACP methyl ester carboxylesterase